MSGECDECDEHTLECMCSEQYEVYMPYQPDYSPMANFQRQRILITEIMNSHKAYNERQKKLTEGSDS